MATSAEASATRDADSLPARGTVFGFDVRSALTFHSLRAGETGDRLEIVEGIVDGEKPGDQLLAEINQPRFLARIFHDGDTYRMWVRGVGWFEVDPRRRRISAPPANDPVQREELLWGVPALLCFQERGDLSLHAAAVEIEGEAILLAAPQAYGKSTLAAGFAQAGYRILSEDLTCVRVAGRPQVVPGPATLRLRNDVAGGIKVEFGQKLGGARDRVRYALDFPGRGDSRPVPIRALVFLRRHENDIRLDLIDPVQCLPDLWQSSFRLNRAHQRACFHHIAGLANQVHSWNLHRPITLEALGPTVDHILAHI